MSHSQPIPGLDGTHRQRVAADLWAAWREDGRCAAVLTGFSGLGKTEQVVRPLLGRARAQGIAAVLVDVPLHPTDLEAELTGHLLEALRNDGNNELAETIPAQSSFAAAARLVLAAGALVVVDEFQRSLDSSARPVEPLGANLRKIAQHTRDDGCLWLVCSREIDPAWTEPFYTTLLEPPTELHDQQRIVLQALAMADREDRFPLDRRVEVVRRLGANPRVLRLLGHLLRHYALDELLGPAGDVPEAPVDPRLTEVIERELLAKARQGLSNHAMVLLRDLTVLREPAEWALVEAVGAPLDDVRPLSRELRDRFLLDVRANRFRVHPVVREVDGPRLRGDSAAWRDAHRRAGSWYATPLLAAGTHPLGDADLALYLAGARYHLVEARETDALREAVRGLGEYVERTYGWTSRRPTSDAERDARLSLLEVYLEEPASAGVEFTFAKLLKERGAPGDLERALPHAEWATADQDFSHPWMLWIQIVREVEGLEAALRAARTAVEHVAPAKSLYSVYQLLGAYLVHHLGRPTEAIDALLEGAERSDGNEPRLIEAALCFAAAEPTRGLLQRVQEWAQANGFDYQVSLASIFQLEYVGDWLGAAHAAEQARAGMYSTYVHLALHEALGWLGADEPENAREALNSFPFPWRYEVRAGNVWLASLVALHNGDLADASNLLAKYLDGAPPTTEAGIRAALLGEWDHRIATVGEANPAFICPILPPAVTGLDASVRRPQYGPPVLASHQSAPKHHGLRRDDSLRVLAVATEWGSGHGGLSTFNRQLCRALAAAGTQVVCVVLDLDSGETQQIDGITLVGAIRTPGRTEQDALSRKPTLPVGFTPNFIIGHGRVTGPAALVLAEDHFPTAKRLHFVHMAPDEIEWYKLDRSDDTGLRAEQRTQMELDLGRSAARVVAVGPRLYQRYLRDLSAYDVPAPLRLDPGFEAPDSVAREPPPGEPWWVLLLGRLEDDLLKGLDIAARAVGLAVERRDTEIPRLEFVVRGAQPDTSIALRTKLREWAKLPSLSVIVRPYTADTERLDADLRRASLLLMPSRSEGFGMVGLEGIVAGTPVLVSSESGLGDLLCGTLEPEQASRLVVPMSGNDHDVAERWGRAVEAVLLDREAAFRRAAKLRMQLVRQKTWAAAVAGLLAECNAVLGDAV